MKNTRYLLILSILSICSSFAFAAESAEPFIGRWALTIPGGGAGWLGVEQKDGYLNANILWGGGSVVRTDWCGVKDNTLFVLRLHKVERKDAAGNVVLTQMLPQYLVGRAVGETLELTQVQPHRNGLGADERPFTGKRIPPLPDAPDLSKVKYGAPVKLFNSKNLDGWKLTNPHAKSAWSVKDGVLTNNPVQEKGKPRVHYGNLRTEGEFEDFNLTLEVNVPRGGNSGIYLKGIYEVQVADTYGRPVDSHNMGGVYSRITPKVAAEKPAGQWQTMDITLVDRHVTVILNGQRIIDNHPLLGCTGGALWSDEFRAGPIYLQGDHTGVNYRNVILRPVVE